MSNKQKADLTNIYGELENLKGMVDDLEKKQIDQIEADVIQAKKEQEELERAKKDQEELERYKRLYEEREKLRREKDELDRAKR